METLKLRVYSRERERERECNSLSCSPQLPILILCQSYILQSKLIFSHSILFHQFFSNVYQQPLTLLCILKLNWYIHLCHRKFVTSDRKLFVFAFGSPKKNMESAALKGNQNKMFWILYIIYWYFLLLENVQP